LLNVRIRARNNAARELPTVADLTLAIEAPGSANRNRCAGERGELIDWAQ